MHKPSVTYSNQAGFTLTELMVVIAVMAIISAFALPAYQDYIETSQNGVLINSMSTIEVFQEDVRMRTGAYAVDLADKAAITAATQWDPRDSAEFTYAIADSDGTFYRMTAADGEGNTICLEFPAKTACP